MGLIKLLLKNKRRVKKLVEFKGFYLISLWGLYSCKGDDSPVVEDDLVFNEAIESNIEGTNKGDSLSYEGREESLVVNGFDGNDMIKTGSGADIVRGGLAVDEIDTGGGDDIILLVGKTGANEYSQEDVEEVLNLVLNAEGEGDNLNNRFESEALSGEVINGGEGQDTLVVYGEVDLTGVRLRGIENVRVYSSLTLTNEQVEEIKLIRGDGSSRIKIESVGELEVEIDLSSFDLEISGLKELELGRGVKLIVSSEEGVELLNSIGMIRGEGLVIFRDGLDDEGSVVTALSLAEDIGGLYEREFVEGEQVVIEGVEIGEGMNVFVDQIIDVVFSLNEGETLVDLGGFDLTGLKLPPFERSIGFSIVDGELRIEEARNYEEDLGSDASITTDTNTGVTVSDEGSPKNYILRFISANYMYRAKLLLINKDDAAMITGDLEGEVKEDLEEEFSVTGTLTVKDEDGEMENSFFVKDAMGLKYGVFSISAEGEWIYKLNNDDLRVQGLGFGKTFIEEIKVESVGGTSEIVRITINGEEEEVKDYEGNFILWGSGLAGSKVSLELVGLDYLELSDFDYQWLRDGVEIASENESVYDVDAKDLGKVISVRISIGELRFIAEDFLVFKPSFDLAGGLIRISGDGLEEGETLETREGEVLVIEVGEVSVQVGEDAAGNGIYEQISAEELDYEYRWYRGRELLEGERGEKYQISGEDIGMRLIAEVIYIHRESGDKLVRRVESEIVEGINDPLEGEVLIIGEARQGSTLFVDVSELRDGDGLDFSSFRYQWYRGDVAIEGATGSSYSLKQVDVGTIVSIKVMLEDGKEMLR